MRRWLDTGCFELLVEVVRLLLREWAGRKGQPTAVCIDSQTLQSTPESGTRTGCPTNENPFIVTPGWDGTKSRRGSKAHIAVDTLEHLLALTVTADEGDRAQVAAPLGRGSALWPGHPFSPPGRDYERLASTLAGLHLLAFLMFMLRNLAKTLAQSREQVPDTVADSASSRPGRMGP